MINFAPISKLPVKTILHIVFFILVTGCASQKKLHVVTVVDNSSQIEPYWISSQMPGDFIGIGERPSKDEAYRAALRDLKTRIGEEIGVELEVITSGSKIETETGVAETHDVEFSILMDAILRDVNSTITDTYWEHCRLQTGRRQFNDFFRYYVRAEVRSSFIDSLRFLTREANEERLSAVSEHLENARGFIRDGSLVQPVMAIQEYTQALGIARNLFYGREFHSRICINEFHELINSLKLIPIQNYSEVRPERHWLEFQVFAGPAKAEGVKIAFRLERGQGRIQSFGITDKDGVVRCAVHEMYSLLPDNRLTAQFDLNDQLAYLATINYPVISKGIGNIQKLLADKASVQQFSTKAKIARVESGSLEIKNVYGYHRGFFRRIDRLNLRFYLREMNGRGVTFDEYELEVTSWFKTGFFSRKQSEETVTRMFRFEDPLEIGYLEGKEFELKTMPRLSSIINELKTSHEMTIKKLQIRIRLLGKDEANNPIAVSTNTGRIPWKSLFEK